MFFSVIVPVYNVEKYLNRCVDSLLGQEFDDFEILLINDGSTDRSAEIAKSYTNYKTIKFVDKKENSGLSNTRNFGMRMARGKYIAFVDSDDYVETWYLRKLNNIIVEHAYPDIVYTGFIEERAQVSKKEYGFVSDKNVCYKSIDFLKNELSKRNLYAAACFGTYSRHMLNENELYFKPGIYHEDELWTPQVLYNARSVFTSELAGYHYVRREDSITKVKDKTQNGLDLLESCKELMVFSRKIEDSELRKLMRNHIAMLYMKAMCRGRMYRKQYCNLIDRSFPLKNTSFKYDRMKSFLFWFSLRMYFLLDRVMGDNEN